MAKRTSPRSKAPISKAVERPTSAGTGFSDMNLGERIAWIAMHVLIFLVPLAVSNLSRFGIGGGMPLTYDQFDIVKLFVMRACTIVALAAWGVSLLMRGGRIRFNKLDWLVLAFLVWVGITTITSIHWPTALFGKYRRFEGLLSFLNYAAVYFLVVQLVDRPSRMRSLLRTFFFSGLLVVIYGALQYVGVEVISYAQLPFEKTRSFATYGNPDLLGGFLMFILPLSFALAFSEERVSWRTIYLLGGVVSAVVWLTAFTRSAWVGGVVAIAVLVIAAFRQHIRLRTEDWVMAGVAALLAIVVVVRSLSAPTEVLNVFARIRSIFEFGEGSALTRFQIWSAAWEAIKDRPIFGFGADTFRLVFPYYKPAAYVTVAGYISVADNVHNYPLQLASAIGIPGFLLLYAIFGSVLWRSFGEAFKSGTGTSRYLYAGIWAASLGYIVHLFFGLSVTGTTVLLWMCFGLLLAPLARTVEVKAPAQAIAYGASGLVVLVATALFFGNVTYVRADHAYLQARIGSTTPQQRIDAAEKAVRLNPFNDMYRAEVGLAYSDYAYAQLSGMGGQPDTQGAFESLLQAEREMKSTIDFVPREYDNYVFLANLYNVMGEYFDPKYLNRAAEVSKKAIRDVEPYGPAIRVEYARALGKMGDKKEAQKQLEFSLKLDPAYGGAALVLAEIYVEQGDTAKALEILRVANSSKPNQPGVAEEIRRLEESQSAE